MAITTVPCKIKCPQIDPGSQLPCDADADVTQDGAMNKFQYTCERNHVGKFDDRYAQVAEVIA